MFNWILLGEMLKGTVVDVHLDICGWDNFEWSVRHTPPAGGLRLLGWFNSLSGNKYYLYCIYRQYPRKIVMTEYYFLKK